MPAKRHSKWLTYKPALTPGVDRARTNNECRPNQNPNGPLGSCVYGGSAWPEQAAALLLLQPSSGPWHHAHCTQGEGPWRRYHGICSEANESHTHVDVVRLVAFPARSNHHKPGRWDPFSLFT